MWPRVEPIPEVLPEVTEGDGTLSIAGSGTVPGLSLEQLRGNMVFLRVEDRESFSNGEGRSLNRALDRWVYPSDTVGYVIGDAEGFSVFASQIDRVAGWLRDEMRFPFVLDYRGDVIRTFGLPKGHTALVIVGRDGQVELRHSGPMSDSEIEHVRALLAAHEPPAGIVAPTFEVGSLSNIACQRKPCALAFLGRSVSGADFPGIDGEDSEAEIRQKFEDPSLKLALWLVGMKLGNLAAGAVVGTLDGVELDGWTLVAEHASTREAFDVADGQVALVIIGMQGRMVFRELGRLPMYKLAIASHYLGVEPTLPTRPPE